MQKIAFIIPAFFLIAVIALISPSYYANAELTINAFTAPYSVGDTIQLQAPSQSQVK